MHCRLFRMKAARRLPALACLLGASLGCAVDRTLTIRTEPDGALVTLNDQEVGRSPITVPFTWYGDYDIVIRKSGFETLKTHYRVDAPWHQQPGIDLITESLAPWIVRDRRELPTFTLTPGVVPAKADVLQRAEEMRQRAAG